MNDSVDRRHFLRQTLLIAGGACILPWDGWGQGNATKGFVFPDPKLGVLLNEFGRDPKYRGASVVALRQGILPPLVSCSVELAHPEAFEGACSSPRKYGFDSITAAGSTLALKKSTEFVEVQIARPTGGSPIFAHDALSLPFGSTTVADPLNAGNTLRLLRLETGAAGLADVLKGKVDAAECRLAPDEAFRQTQARVLAAEPSNRTEAEALLRTFAQHLVSLANALPDREMSALVASKAIATSLRLRLGLNVREIEETRRRHAQHGRPTPAAAWIAAVLAPEIALGRASWWLAADISPARTKMAEMALRQAKSLL